MPKEILRDIINDFSLKKFNAFFREKSDKYRDIEEKLSRYDKDIFYGTTRIGLIDFGGRTKDVVIIGVKTEKDLTERSSKKAQYGFAKDLLKKEDKYEAGVFIFYDESGSFRFSLIYPQYQGTKRVWNTFRRFTYFINPELTNKTFLDRIGNGDFSILEKIKEAFSVEKVTKEFYLEYRKLFEGLLSELSKNHTFKNEANKNNISTDNFAKKLLGQIVFLYFVQKKGWLGVPSGSKWGEGNKNFMGDLFREALKKKANFFNDYLEKLFYNALNNPRCDFVDQSFSKDFNCRIPFLNGGLFEAEYNWKDSLICLDNKIFQEIFDVFDRYNFTVEEEGPDDKEIAVDPEMLGKVFENLLPENLRKGKGTYYTPREIVYYMCRESLVNYLVSNHSNITEKEIRGYIFYSESFENFKTQKGQSFVSGQWKELDDLLKNIKICDPACGSGAFLVGMLNLIVRLRLYFQTTPDFHLIPLKNEYELKKETIQNCIYGVDIDPGAIEIAKLRLWLSLVVDYGVEDIEPLPNLDYHLMCGNSLLEEYEGVKFYNGEDGGQQATLLADTDKQKKIAELRKKVKEYFDIHDDKEKQIKRKEINDIKDWLVRSALEKRKQDLASQRKNEEAKADMLDKKSREQYLASWSGKFLAEAKIKEVLDDLHNPKAAKPFFVWKLEFIDVFEDKKGFDVVIANPPYDVYEGHRRGEIEEIRSYTIYDKATGGKLNAYKLFLAKSVLLQRPEGTLCEIFQNSFLADNSATKIRKYFLQNQRIIKIDSFPERDDINLRVFEGVKMSVCILLSNNIISSPEFKFKLNIWRDKYMSSGRHIILSGKDILGLDPDNATIPSLDQIELNILKKVSKNRKLKTMGRCYEGEINLTFHKKLLSKKKAGNSPMIKGAAVQKWFIKEKMSQGEIEYLDKAAYQKENGGDKSKHYKLSRIVMQGITGVDEINRLKMTIIEPGIFCGNSVNYILISDKDISAQYLLSLLNSRLLNWFFKTFSTNSNVNGYEVDNLPIIDVSASKQKPLINLVSKIMDVAKSADYEKSDAKRAKVKEYEKQIDQLVYKLYGLTDEEIKTIEDDFKK